MAQRCWDRQSAATGQIPGQTPRHHTPPKVLGGWSSVAARGAKVSLLSLCLCRNFSARNQAFENTGVVGVAKEIESHQREIGTPPEAQGVPPTGASSGEVQGLRELGGPCLLAPPPSLGQLPPEQQGHIPAGDK